VVQFFWVGMRMGFTMRQQVVAAIHQKVLRLNSASVVHANTGHIVNLASNDVRRFDDAVPFWLFIWAAPLETAAVLLMVSLELGFVPAICGVGACLSVMPLQSLLVRTVAGLRRNTARKTDARVRLTGEVIQGALAMKMLGWEDPFTAAICKIRSQEVKYAGRMAQIKGLNLALQFAMTPVATFTTFAVYYALGGTLSLPSVFYVLSLLHLPKVRVCAGRSQGCICGGGSFCSGQRMQLRVCSAYSDATLFMSVPCSTHAHMTNMLATWFDLSPLLLQSLLEVALGLTHNPSCCCCCRCCLHLCPTALPSILLCARRPVPDGAEDLPAADR
jgi:ATP-binding cassette subfamily C (CFTR/MRP) protein 4